MGFGAGQTLRLGLTGGIGSGKSTVAQFLVRRGGYLVDADAISRQLTQPGGAGVAPVIQAFGPAVAAADGSLNRAVLRERVFNDSQSKLQLESILHPLIGQQVQQQTAAALAAGAAAVVHDVPLLAESRHWRARVDRVLVVDCSVETQVERVAQRPGWTREMAAKVAQAQATRPMRRSVADAVIHNDGLSLAALQAEVDALWHRWVPANHADAAPKA